MVRVKHKKPSYTLINEWQSKNRLYRWYNVSLSNVSVDKRHKILADELKRKVGYTSELLSIPDEKISEYLRAKIAEIDLRNFINDNFENKQIYIEKWFKKKQ